MNDRLPSANNRLWILALCMCIPAWTAGLHAQSEPASQFLFPHFVSYPEESTGIAIFNPGERAATAVLLLRDADGKPVATVTNPVSLTIPARGQMAKTAGELFPAASNLDGSLQITSSAPGLVAYYQTFDPAMTFLDGADAPAASLSLIFPVIPSSNEGIAEIDLINPNFRETSVDLKLWSFDGNLLGSATVHVPAGGTYRSLAQDAFPAGTSFSGASHITAESKARNVLSAAQTVAGTSLFRGFSSQASSSGGVDLAALNAVPLTQAANSGVIPYFHVGGGYASTLALVNVEPANESVSLTAVDNNGSILGTHRVSIKPQGGLRAPLQNVFSEFGSREQEGWLLIQSSGRTVGGIIYGRSDAASLTALPLQRTAKSEFVFPQVVLGSGLHTDVTLANSASTATDADVTVVGADGTTLAASRITLGSSKRVSAPLKQLMPELGDLGGGVVHVRASGGLFATLSIWSDSGSIATNFTPEDTSFLPSPLTSWAVTGRVLVNGSPTAGFRVVLSGDVAKVAVSDEDGAYAFTNLPAGNYSLAVDQFGLQFVPAEVDFEITDASVRHDFQGFTDADGILVQPASFPVGSTDSTIAVFGRDFNPTSEAFAGAIRLETTIVDSAHLQAVVPAFMLATADTFEIAIVTNGSLSSRRVSKAYPIVVFQERPVLKAIVTTTVITEGSPAGYIILQGTGFLEGARVKVNGSSDGIQVTVVSDTEIVASLPASYFAQGGIYPVTVENPYPANAESQVQLLTVYYPPPAVDSILPRSCPVRLEADASPLNLEVRGYGFRRGAVVTFDGTPLITTYCETDAYCLATRLFAKVPVEMLRRAGLFRIDVQNPDPALAGTEAAYLQVDGLQPTIGSVMPGSATVLEGLPGFSMPIIVDGTNFGPDTQVVVYKLPSSPPPADKFASPSELVSSTQLVVWLPVDFSSIGEWAVEVLNGQPGGGRTDPVSFFITEGSFVADPFLMSLSPGTVAPGGPSFTLTINGINLKSGAVVNFNTTALVTTFVSKFQVTAIIPASLIRSAGRVPISVTNPDNGGTSNRLFLDIR